MTAYDRIAYINRPLAQTHPNRMAVLGLLHGLNPAPIETARVLDLGASEGGNIVAMAVELPSAQFTAVELAQTPVESGNRTIRDLGLQNARLLQMDLLDIHREFGEFDYIVAHGLYAWTPEAVRDKVLAIAGTNLSPNGMAFVSYNTLPQGHVRKVLREAMLEAIGDEKRPLAQLEIARDMLRILAEGRPNMKEREEAVAEEAREMANWTDSALYHDYLSPVFEPVRFLDFVAHAARHGLAQVADAHVLDTYNFRLHPQTVEGAKRLAKGDRLREEQLMDVVRLRGFRQSVLCRAERQPLPDWDPSRLAGCYIASNAQEISAGKFTSPQEVTITTRTEAVLRLLRRLIAIWPLALPVEDEQGEMAAELYKRGMLEIRTMPGTAGRAGDWPFASPLARYQLAKGEPGVSTLHHQWIEIGDPTAREFIALLDGTRDHSELGVRMNCATDDIEFRLRDLERLALFPG